MALRPRRRRSEGRKTEILEWLQLLQGGHSVAEYIASDTVVVANVPREKCLTLAFRSAESILYLAVGTMSILRALESLSIAVSELKVLARATKLSVLCRYFA